MEGKQLTFSTTEGAVVFREFKEEPLLHPDFLSRWRGSVDLSNTPPGRGSCWVRGRIQP
ncbi:MAG TPA: hypothetical protein VM492_08120 [Sumerlaeia bacterium]|nr:hypothetical protein [Sumerlaeia bacterium]